MTHKLIQKLVTCLANIRHDAIMLSAGLSGHESASVVERIIGEATEGLKANADEPTNIAGRAGEDAAGLRITTTSDPNAEAVRISVEMPNV